MSLRLQCSSKNISARWWQVLKPKTPFKFCISQDLVLVLTLCSAIGWEQPIGSMDSTPKHRVHLRMLGQAFSDHQLYSLRQDVQMVLFHGHHGILESKWRPRRKECWIMWNANDRWKKRAEDWQVGLTMWSLLINLTIIVLEEWWGLKPDWIGFNREWWEERNQTMRTDCSLKMVCYREKQKKWWAIWEGSEVKIKVFSFERWKNSAARLYVVGKIQ